MTPGAARAVVTISGLVIWAALVSAGAEQSSTASATALLSAARASLGGEAALAGVKTLAITGREPSPRLSPVRCSKKSGTSRFNSTCR